MKIEVEIKFPVEGFAEVEKKLVEISTPSFEVVEEHDRYFNSPSRDFAVTGEAFRLRSTGKNANFLTYKGPKLAGRAKSRKEIEVSSQSPAEDFISLLSALGYKETVSTHKIRRTYFSRHDDFWVRVNLDDVRDIGKFVEIEIISTEERRAAAEEVITLMAAQLGLTKSTDEAYAEMARRV